MNMSHAQFTTSRCVTALLVGALLSLPQAYAMEKTKEKDASVEEEKLMVPQPSDGVAATQTDSSSQDNTAFGQIEGVPGGKWASWAVLGSLVVLGVGAGVGLKALISGSSQTESNKQGEILSDDKERQFAICYTQLIAQAKHNSQFVEDFATLSDIEQMDPFKVYNAGTWKDTIIMDRQFLHAWHNLMGDFIEIHASRVLCSILTIDQKDFLSQVSFTEDRLFPAPFETNFSFAQRHNIRTLEQQLKVYRDELNELLQASRYHATEPL